jgi:hypothetical protein
MERQDTKPLVLARIPDLGTARRSEGREGLPQSKGRVFSQALSFKLLATVALVLVAVAMIPWTLTRSAPSADPPAVVDSSPQWHVSPSAATANAVPPPTYLVAQSVTAARSPTNSTMAPPDTIPLPRAAGVSAASAPTDPPPMSLWPNPAHPISPSTDARVEESHVGVNQAMTLPRLDPVRSSQ